MTQALVLLLSATTIAAPGLAADYDFHGHFASTSSTLDVEARDRLTNPDIELLKNVDMSHTVKAAGLAP